MRSLRWPAALVVAVLSSAWAAACGSSKSGFTPSGGDDASVGPDGAQDVATEKTGPGPETGPLGDGGPQTRDDFPNPILDTGAPSNAAALFSAADVGTDGPCIYEPEMGSLFPSNWMRLRYRYSTTHQENLFEIRMVIPNEAHALVIYTPASSYTLDATTWKILTTVGAGAGPIQVSVRSIVLSGGALSGGPWAGTTGTIEVAPAEATGTVVYWTTSNGTVLKGFNIGDEKVKQVLSTGEAKAPCIGCHTSTPDGLYVGLTDSSDGVDAGVAGYVDMRSEDGTGTRPNYATQNALLLLERTPQHAPSFSKGHWQLGDHVVLTMFDVSSKSEIIWTDLESQQSGVGAGWGIIQRNSDINQAASALFSHDGTRIVYTSASSVSSGITTSDGRIYTVPYNSRQGGTAQPLPGASDPGALQFYPAFSADDQFVAFDKATGGSSYNNSQAEIYVVPSGGGTATRLAANDPPACTGKKSPGITNSWPKWSPAVATTSGNKYYWLVFSSTRDPAEASPTPQLYVAPMMVDATGKLTTYSALYFWNQPETEHNHTPAWDVFQIGTQ